jgi:hypothetical protein
MPVKYFAPSLVLALTVSVPAQADDLDRLPEREAQAYPLIKPAAKDVRWKKIPWVIDLDEGVKLARAEKRPILLWTAGDDPLERC